MTGREGEGRVAEDRWARLYDEFDENKQRLAALEAARAEEAQAKADRRWAHYGTGRMLFGAVAGIVVGAWRLFEGRDPTTAFLLGGSCVAWLAALRLLARRRERQAGSS